MVFSCQTNEKTLLLNSLFSDGMVLQQNENIPFWGTSKPNQKIQVVGSWGAKSSATSDNNGEWILYLKTPVANGPFNIIIPTDGGETITINDALIGEVWLASGQSNMEMNFNYCCNTTDNSDFEISTANYPYIRMFNITKQYSLISTSKINGKWTKVNGKW